MKRKVARGVDPAGRSRTRQKPPRSGLKRPRRWLPASISKRNNGLSPAEQLAECAAEAAELHYDLGVDEMAPEEEEVLLAEVDPAAALSKDDETLEQCAQQKELLRTYQVSELVRCGIRDTQRVVGTVERRALRRLVKYIKARLLDYTLDPDYRRQLAADAEMLLLLWEKDRTEALARRKKKAQPESPPVRTTSAEERKTLLLKMMIDLRQGPLETAR